MDVFERLDNAPVVDVSLSPAADGFVVLNIGPHKPNPSKAFAVQPALMKLAAYAKQTLEIAFLPTNAETVAKAQLVGVIFSNVEVR